MRSFKKLAAILMLVSFIFAAVTPAMALTDYSPLEKITNIAGENGGNARGNSSTIYFGNYWQTLKSGATSGSTNLSDYNKEGIKWRVLANNTTPDPTDTSKKGVLLLSDQALYADQFNSFSVAANKNVWGKDESTPGAGDGISSEIRTTMNKETPTTFNEDGTVQTWGGFAGDAFSGAELAAITDTTHTAGGEYSGKDIVSTDKIFLLSYGEATNESYGFTPTTAATDTRKAPATEMAQHVKMYGNTSAAYVSDGSSYWWLRSPGNNANFAYSVDASGVDVSYVYIVDSAARPALNLNQESILLLSAAVATKSDGTNYDKNSKSQVGVGNGFALADYDGSNGWKLTLTDTSIAKPNVTQAEIVGKTWDVNDLAKEAKTGTKIIEISDQTPAGDGGLKIAYNGATTGTNMYVSALLKDSSGNYVNYAKVSQAAADTKIIDVSGITAADYTLCIYGEQENGDYQTDYASALSEHNITIPTEMPAPTVNKILSSDYAAEGLTAKISNGLELGFEAGEYDTAVTIENGKSGKITADAANGTTLTGDISVGTGATLTTANKFTLKGDNTVDGTLKGDALTIAGGTTTVNETGSIENALTVTADGTLELNADKYGVTGGVGNPVLNGGSINLTGGTLTKAVTGGNLNVNGDVTSKADYIAGDTNTVTSGNILTLSAGTLAKEISGEGTTKIAGKVTAAADIATTLTVDTLGELTTSADNLGGETTNKGTVTLTDGTLAKEISGEGTTKITGDVTADADIATALTVDTAGELTASADSLGGETTNKGTVTLTDGTLAKEISGEGTTKITGDVTADADIATTLTVDTLGELTASADSLKNDVTNSGIVSFTGGTLAKNYTSTGTTNFKGKTTFSGEVSLTNSTINFYLDGFVKGDTIVETAEKVDLTDTTVGLVQKDTGYKLDKEGDTITLITNAENYEYSEIETQDGVHKYKYGVGITDGALMLGYLDQGVADQTKSFSEARLAGSAAINSASDLVAGQAIDSASASNSWEAFAAMGGSHGRYETGSHVDLNSFNVAAGLSKKIKDNVTLGIFVEGGNGRYTTENEFEDGNVRADGDINYFGGGIFAKIEGKKTAKGQLHGEASFRAGHTNSDYNSETFNPGTSTRFDTSNAYMGAHLGLGYKWALKDNSNIDTYVKYLWNRQNSDSPVINGEQFDLDAINSHRLRAGFRYNGKENENGVKFFGGLAYEYEFDGKAKGRMGEYALLEPDFKGGSGMAELGIKYHKPNSPWKVELGLTGYTGKRDSIGANLGAWYEFGK